MLRWFLILITAAAVQAQVYEGKTVVTASLIADTSAVVPGKPFEVGLLLEMAPDWHTYWEYAGDAGIPTTIDWTLPEGFDAGPIQWPLPERLKEPGDIEVYAYGGKVLLMTTIVPPAQLTAESVTLQALAKWLVCAEVCIPGSEMVQLTLPVAAQSVSANDSLFAEFRSQLPSDPLPYDLAWKREGKTLTLSVAGLGDARSVDLFPLPAQDQQIDHPQGGIVSGGVASITMEVEGDCAESLSWKWRKDAKDGSFPRMKR